jgi:two-component system sensor histidine kinase BarA
MLMLGIGGELSETQSQFAKVIAANVDRMGKLVNDLLEISRLEAGRIKLKLDQIQPHEIVSQALAAIQADLEARTHALEVQVPGDLPFVTGDRDRLLQILKYLLSNACMYTPDGGTIRVGASEPDPPAGPSGHLLFSISDTGIGISAKDLARLDKFFRADHDLVVSQPGTGLGISIARGLVELHGGELMIESEPDQGSAFRFTIPIAQSDGA